MGLFDKTVRAGSKSYGDNKAVNALNAFGRWSAKQVAAGEEREAQRAQQWEREAAARAEHEAQYAAEQAAWAAQRAAEQAAWEAQEAAEEAARAEREAQEEAEQAAWEACNGGDGWKYVGWDTSSGDYRLYGKRLHLYWYHAATNQWAAMDFIYEGGGLNTGLRPEGEYNTVVRDYLPYLYTRDYLYDYPEGPLHFGYGDGYPDWVEEGTPDHSWLRWNFLGK